MISVTCTNCKAVLTIDDAFAGGVCRCQHCGTIQTVPRRAAQSPVATAPQPAVARGPQALYRHETRGPMPAAGESQLDELAEIVASSSGLAGSGLSDGRGNPVAPSSSPEAVAVADQESDSRTPLVPILLIAGGAMVVLLAILLAILLARGHSGNNAGSAGVVGTGSAAESFHGPTFCGIPLDAASAIFILDRGNSLADLFDTLKATCYKSLQQLGPDRKFQVILWDNDSGSTEFPVGTMRNATAGAIDDCRRDFQDLVAGGSSHLSGPLREALGRHPQRIIIVTGKMELDDDDMTTLRSVGGAGVRIDAVQIGAPAPNAALEQAAKSTGGQLKLITTSELRDFSR